MTGYLSDHAPDQKKVFRELEVYHQECNLELLGENVMLLEDPETDDPEMEQVLDKKTEEMVKGVGGAACWMELSEEECLWLVKDLVWDVEICLGEWVLEWLPKEQKEEVMHMGCYWSGCRMHKDLNAVKEGADWMLKWWEEAGKTPLIVLMNKFKAETGSGGEVCWSDTKFTSWR
jgi:hypothetical protein